LQVVQIDETFLLAHRELARFGFVEMLKQTTPAVAYNC
jgi:hypothetical protein